MILDLFDCHVTFLENEKWCFLSLMGDSWNRKIYCKLFSLRSFQEFFAKKWNLIGKPNFWNSPISLSQYYQSYSINENTHKHPKSNTYSHIHSFNGIIIIICDKRWLLIWKKREGKISYTSHSIQMANFRHRPRYCNQHMNNFRQWYVKHFGALANGCWL